MKFPISGNNKRNNWLENLDTDLSMLSSYLNNKDNQNMSRPTSKDQDQPLLGAGAGQGILAPNLAGSRVYLKSALL